MPLSVKVANFNYIQGTSNSFKRAACLCMYRGLATPNRKRAAARFFYSMNFPCSCGGNLNISYYERNNVIFGNMFLPVVFIRNNFRHRMDYAITGTKYGFNIFTYLYSKQYSSVTCFVIWYIILFHFIFKTT